jgi:hypothetical protein
MNDGTVEDEDRQGLYDALKELGFDFPVGDELRALTASAEGEALFALVIVIGTGLAKGWYEFCKSLGSALGDDAHEALKSIFSLRQVIVRDGKRSAIVDADTPPEAVEELADATGTPSGEMYWDKRELRWKDDLSQ